MTHRKIISVPTLLMLCMMFAAVGCKTTKTGAAHKLERKGEEIVVAGQYFSIGTPVVLWTDPGGYDAYRVERRFCPIQDASWEVTEQKVKDIKTPERYGMRYRTLTDEEIELVRGGGWPLSLLQEKVDQFVVHYDVCGTSRTCFKVLHDVRGLSVQFMLDIDGTIYQTCDLKEACWHATRSNHRSVGIEIANMGAYSGSIAPLAEWYKKDENGQVHITIPSRFGDGGLRVKGLDLRPARNEMIEGTVQNTKYRQYDLTPQQYAALTKLTAALCTVFPKINCDYPKDSSGKLIDHVLTDEQWDSYQGVMGHWHVQQNKQDPGPAFQWDLVIDGARELMSADALAANKRSMGQPVKYLTNGLTSARPPTTAPSTTPVKSKT